MSKLTRALTLAAMLATSSLAGMTAVAHASDQSTSHDARRPATDRQVTSPQQAAADAAHLRLLLAEERSSIPNVAPAQAAADAAHRRALAQERSYSTWDYGDTSAPAPAEPSGQAGWLTPALGVLAAVLALVAGVAVVAARRANRSQRAGQTV